MVDLEEEKINFLFTICYLTFEKSHCLTSNETLGSIWAINH